MEIAIRWDQASTPDKPAFLLADVKNHTFKLCEVTGRKQNTLQWREISHNSKAPSFRAFDWSCKQGLVAIGLWTGETTVLGLDQDSSTLSLPVKSQRQCNAVAFNSGTLLGTGLEKIRNDFCLNVYDIHQWASTKISGASQIGKQVIEPVRKLASSEGITSIKFFPDQPNILATGIKGTCIRIYDLRESTGNPALQFSTTCVHNIAIDPRDPSYFASAGTNRESTVLIWDKRATSRSSGSRAASARPEDPVLRLENVFGFANQIESPAIWSLRYSVTERSCLGILGSLGNFQLVRMNKDSEMPEREEAPYNGHNHISSEAPEALYVDRTEIVGDSIPVTSKTAKSIAVQVATQQIRAFDFMNLSSSDGKHQAVILRGNQEMEFYQLKRPVSAIAVSARSEIFLTDMTKFRPSGGLPSGLRSVLALQSRTIAEDLENVERRIAATAVKQLDQTTLSANIVDDDDDDDGWNDDSEFSPVKPQPSPQFNSSAVARPRVSCEAALVLADAPRRRALEGYLFDAKKNKQIVRSDDKLVQMWSWLEGSHLIFCSSALLTYTVASDNASSDKMRSDEIDMSYLGVYNIWHATLGKQCQVGSLALVANATRESNNGPTSPWYLGSQRI